jgi:hypothetical protein
MMQKTLRCPQILSKIEINGLEYWQGKQVRIRSKNIPENLKKVFQVFRYEDLI